MHLVPDPPAGHDDVAVLPSLDRPRPGLRSPPPAGAPTGAFVVVEMTILVIVVALAMVAVIVASADDAGHDRAAFATRPAAHQEFGLAVRTQTLDGTGGTR